MHWLVTTATSGGGPQETGLQWSWSVHTVCGRCAERMRGLLFLLWGCFSWRIHSGRVGPNIAVILNTTRCSRARHTLASPKGVFQMWQHDKRANQNINKFINGHGNCGASADQYVAIDYHYLTRTFYMTNIGQRIIEAYDIKDANKYRKRPVFKGISKKTTGIAVDWINNNIYWADPAYDAILMTATDGSGQLFQNATVVVGSELDAPTGLAVQPYIGRIFWSDGHRLESARLDGTNRTLLRIDLLRPKGMCIDYYSNRLYWIEWEFSESVVRSTDLQGRDLTIALRRPNSQLFDLDIYQGFIVTTDEQRGVIAIHDVALNRSLEKAWGGKPLGIVIDAKAVTGKGVPHRTISSPYNRGVILLATSTDIYRLNRNFAEVKNKDDENLVHIPLHPRMNIYALTANAHTDYIYYYEEAGKEGRILRVKMKLSRGKSEDQFTPEPLATAAVKEVSDLAIDWVTRNLYWADKANSQILVAREDGRFPAVVVERHLESPRTVVVDPLNMFIFWGDKLNIGRAGLDGTHVKYNIFQVNHRNHRIAVDPTTTRIYFSDKILLCYGDYLGQGKKCGALSSSRSLVNGLAIMNDYILWSRAGGGLYAQDKDTFAYVGQSYVEKEFHDISIYHTSSQPAHINNCTKSNGGCEQLCLPNLTNQGRSCKCTVGYWDQQDGSCTKAHLMEPYLVFTDERLDNIYQGSLILNMYGMFTLQSLAKPKDVAVDTVGNKIYWTDYLGIINCAYFNGSHQHVVYADKIVKPVNIALDVASKLVYFVDNRGNIGVVHVVTGVYQQLLGRDVIKAQDIALSPEEGLMFISGQTEVRNGSTNVTERLQCITMSHMDGTNLEQVAFGLGQPRGITVYRDRVIWADAKYQTLEEVRVGSWNRTVLVENMRQAPIDVVVHRGYLYWTETGARYVLRTPLTDPIVQEMYMPSSRFFTLGGLDVASDEFNYTSACQRHRCQDPRSRHGTRTLSTHTLCIPTPRGAVCDSPSERFDSAECHFGRRDCTEREKYMEMTFCRIPSLGNGTVHNVTVGSYVPITFKIHVTCNVGFRLTKGITTHHSEHDIPLHPDENMCLSTGKWAEEYMCQWDMPYKIHGTFSRGIVKFYVTSKFLVPPGIRTLDVICIGGGGGGFSRGRRGGDGGTSIFAGRLEAFGGGGGSARHGGTGGWGYSHNGGRGGDNGTCWFGGATGQIERYPFACVIGSTDCPFCGAGGYGNTTDCVATNCTVLSGACSGPWAITRTSLSGSDYGGGAGSLTGGSGGAAGYSRRRWMHVKPEEIVNVTVGAGGHPSSAAPGDGIVVVAWGDKIENFHPSDEEWKRRSCHYLNPRCSCVLRTMNTYRLAKPNRYL